MAKIIYKKMWVEWCDSCGHGFKVDAENIQIKTSLIKRILRKPKNLVETIKPAPSPCPVCGKTDNVTVIKLQEDKVTLE